MTKSPTKRRGAAVRDIAMRTCIDLYSTDPRHGTGLLDIVECGQGNWQIEARTAAYPIGIGEPARGKPAEFLSALRGRPVELASRTGRCALTRVATVIQVRHVDRQGNELFVGICRGDDFERALATLMTSGGDSAI